MLRIYLFSFLYSFTSLLFAEQADKDIIQHLKKNIPTLIGPNYHGGNLDPLKVEDSNNIYVIPLLYPAPIKHNVNDSFESQLLNEYSYSRRHFSVTLRVKKGAKFSDGSPITASDIAATIKRAILFDQEGFKFIIEHDKLKSVADSISGIKILDINTLKIFYTDPVLEPLMWLSEKNMGVIKAEYINSDGSLKGASPFSGQWVIENHTDKIIIFRSGNKHLSIVSINPEDLAKYTKFMRWNHLIVVDTGYLAASDYEDLNNNLSAFFQEKVRIMYFTLDSNREPFNDKRVRQFLAAEVRKYMKNKGLRPQGSLVPFGEPEFIPLSVLEEQIRFSDTERAQIIDKLSKSRIVFKNYIPTCYSHIANTLNDLGIKTVSEGKGMIGCYMSGVTKGSSLQSIRSFLGWGRFEPISFFIRGKEEVQNLLNADTPASKTVSKVNRYLFDEAFVSVIQHNQLGHFTAKVTNVIERKNKVYFLEDYFTFD